VLAGLEAAGFPGRERLKFNESLIEVSLGIAPHPTV
jgi:hypothetical protein